MARSSESRFGADDARRFYNRMGAAQDSQAFYENAAVDRLLREGRFEEAHEVFELGCGTGRIAARLLRDVLPPGAEYLGVDVSSTMVRLTRERLAEWPDRAEVLQVCGGDEPLPAADASVDRVLSTYVFDLLSDADRAWTLSECHRVLRKGGLLCHAGIAPGEGPITATVSGIWRGLHALSPWLVGGCRPLMLSHQLDSAEWIVSYTQRLSRFAVTSEVLVAEAT